MPIFSVSWSIAPALDMGSLRAEMMKFPWKWFLVAAWRAWRVGSGSLGSLMWLIVAGGRPVGPSGIGGRRFDCMVSLGDGLDGLARRKCVC